jgi:hypothetical protein
LGRRGPARIAGPIVSAFVVGRRELMSKYDELMTLTERETAFPLWQREASAVDDEIYRLNNDGFLRNRYLFITMTMPSFARAGLSTEWATQERDATLVAIALELYRRKHGHYPPALDALVPQFLPAVSPDRYDGDPLKYKLADNKPLLYSVGANRVDDGGTLGQKKGESASKANQRAREWIAPSRLPQVPLAKEAIKGDWLLWPPVEV